MRTSTSSPRRTSWKRRIIASSWRRPMREKTSGSRCTTSNSWSAPTSWAGSRRPAARIRSGKTQSLSGGTGPGNCKIFEKRDKKTEYLHRFWAKQKITDRMARGLCFFRILVYNRVAAVVAALFSCLKTRGTRVLARNCGMYFGNAPYRACHEAGPRQGDHKIGKICCYGRQSPAW